MRFFTQDDLLHAAGAMLSHIDLFDRTLMGIMSGIKRRARARAIVEFAKQLSPAPPDYSITTMRALLGRLFGRSISNNDLHRHFAKPGRRADDRVDTEQFDEWFAEHGQRFQQKAEQLLSDLDEEWRVFTNEAARRTAGMRREDRAAERAKGTAQPLRKKSSSGRGPKLRVVK
jgi:hypothetical protein